MANWWDDIGDPQLESPGAATAVEPSGNWWDDIKDPEYSEPAPGGMADSLRARSGDDMPSEPAFDPDPMGMGNLYNPAGFGDVKEVDQQDYEADVIAQHRQDLARSAADQASLNRVEDINPLRRTIPVRAAEKLYEGVGGGGAGAVATGLGAAAEFVGADDTAAYFKGKAKQIYATMARRAGDQKMIGRTTSGDIPFSDEISSGLAAVGEAIAVTMATGGGAEAATLAAKAKAMIPFTTWFGAKAGAETLSETGDYTQAATSALIEGAWTLGGGMAGGGLARFAGVSSNALSRAAANAAAKVKLPKWTGEVLSGSAIEAMQEAGTEASHYWAEVGFGRRKWDRKEFIQRMKEAAGPALVAGGLGGAFGAYANRMADAFEKRQRIMPEEVGKADTAVKAAETILAEQPEVAKELSEVEGTPSRRQFEEITKDPGKTDVTHRETVVEEIRRQLETPTEPNIAEQNIEQKTEQPAEQPIAQPQSEEQVTEPITEQQTEQVVEQAEQFTEPFRLDPTPEPPAPPPVGENVPTRQPDLITDLWRESLPGQQGLFEGEKPEPPAESYVPDTGQDGWMDPQKIKLDPARFQFKAGHKETGEVRGNELTGTWNDAASGVILVWEDKNGEVYAVNGHHRVPHAQRHKVPRVRVSVLREADGVTPAQARSQGAIINIFEGQGSVKDYADFAKSTDLTWEAAERAGLLGRQKGREGIAIGSLSTDDLYAAFRNTKISASKAAAIAEAAPKDARLQNLGLEIARRDKDLSAEEIKHSLKLAAAQAKAGPQAKQTDMFGYDDSAIQESIKITRAATKIVDALNDRRLAVEGALRRPEQAKEMGLSGDFVSIQAEHAGLVEERERWKHWTTDPELYRRARQEAGLEPPDEDSDSEPEEDFGEADYGPNHSRPRGEAGRGDPYAQTANPKPATVTGKTAADLKPFPLVELVRLVQRIIGEDALIVRKKMKSLGMMKPIPGKPEIHIRADQAEDAKQLAGLVAHEFGHIEDFFPDGSMERGNLLGRVASLRGYLKRWLAGEPGGLGPLTDKERERLRKEAKKLTGKDSERIITREIMERIPVTAQDILNIWNLVDQSKLNPELLAYVKGLSTAEKLSIVKEAMRGQAPAEVQRFSQTIGTGKFETITETVPASPADYAKKYQELLHEEIRKRQLLSLDEITKELKALSAWWRGPIPKEGWYASYRKSGKELYADAISVLFNSPGDLKERAPGFFRGYFNYLDSKPEIRKEYLGIIDLINGTPEDIADARRTDIRERYGRGRDIVRARIKEIESGKQSAMDRIGQMLVDRGMPLLKREKASLPKDLSPWDERRAMKHALDEFNMSGNALHLFGKAVEEQVSKPLAELGVDSDDIGEYMEMSRVAEGDRGGFADDAQAQIKAITGIDDWFTAKQEFREMFPPTDLFANQLLEQSESGKINPGGFMPDTAREQLASLRAKLGDHAYRELQAAVQRLHDLHWQHVEEAVKVGTYNRRTVAGLRPNKDFYAPFLVLKYLDAKVKAGIFKQVGTFEGVANPYEGLLMKTMSLIRLNELQKVKMVVRDFLRDQGELGEAQYVDQSHPPKSPPVGKEHMWVLEDGKLVNYPVEPYINKVFQSHDIGALDSVARWLGSAHRIFYPLWIGYNIGWWVRNSIRDPLRTYNNMSTLREGGGLVEAILDVPRMGAAFLRAIPPSWRRAHGLDDATINRMMKERTIAAPYVRQPIGDDTLPYDRMLMETGVWKKPQSRNAILRTLATVVEEVKNIGTLTETVSKVAMDDLARNMKKKERTYIVRNLAGTPNTSRKGLAVKLSNSLWMFSNVMMQGYRADAEVALYPKTAGGRWIRAGLTQYIPKAAAAAAASGLLGAALKEFYDAIPEHDKTKYICVPLGWSDGKPVYLRLPHNDTDRVLAAAAWKLSQKQSPEGLGEAFSLAAGDFPGINPYLQMANKWTQYLAGGVPRDDFRNRDIMNPDQQAVGGWERLKPMLLWTTDQAGMPGQYIRVIAEWNKNTNTGEATGTFEKLINSTPGLNALVKVSDRGKTEQLWDEVREEDRADAQLRLSMPDSVHKAARERSQLNRRGVERLDQKQRIRRQKLNTWDTGYRNYRRKIVRAEADGDSQAAEDARQRLDEFTRKILGPVNQPVPTPPPAAAPPARP